MFKKLMMLAIAVATLSSITAQAQTDAKAKTILDGVSKKINGLSSMKANFSLKLISANGKTQQSKSGQFYMKGPKYQVDLGSEKIICDNKNVWTYMKGVNEVQVSKYNPNEQTISPAKLFTNFVDKEYKYKFVGDKNIGGKTVSVVELVPIASGKQFKKVVLMVDKASSTLVGGNIWEKSGNQYEYKISGFTANPTLSESLFTFDAKKYPGVEVVDMR